MSCNLETGDEVMKPFIAHFAIVCGHDNDSAVSPLTFDPTRELAMVHRNGTAIIAIDDPSATGGTGSLLTEVKNDSSRDEPTER